MLIKELILIIENSEFIDNAVDKIEDLLAFLKINGLDSIKTDQLLDELAGEGINIDFEQLVNIIGDFDVVDDINREIITLDKRDLKTAKLKIKAKDEDLDKIKKMATKISKKNLKRKFKG